MDLKDAQWLCQLLEHGLLRSSFVAPKPIRELRDLTRYRKSLVWERAREANRLQKVLEDANIKLACIASRPLGASGKAMLRELCEGNHDPVALADLAKGKLRAKLPALRQALEGRFRDHHALLVSHLLAHIEYLDETIGSLSAEVEERMRPFERQRELLCTIPGVAERTAEVIIAELGPDMDRFPSHRHAASWAAICPGHDESAGKGRYLGVLRLLAGVNTDDYFAKWNDIDSRLLDYLNVRYVVGARNLVMKDTQRYRLLYDDRDGRIFENADVLPRFYGARNIVLEFKGDYFVRREDQERLTQRLVRQLERLGQSVTLKPALEVR